MSQPPKTDLARKLWEMCPVGYGQLVPDGEGRLECGLGHYSADNGTQPPHDPEPGRRIMADGRGVE